MEFKVSWIYTVRPCPKQTTNKDTKNTIQVRNKTFFFQTQVCPWVWTMAFRGLEGVGGLFGLFAHPTLNTKISGRTK